ncbi:MAG: hypothetical protein ABSD71_00240 [Bacteroidales bacterium]|jgi:hypothetical protein
MNTLLNKIIKENSNKFDTWVDQINEYTRIWNSDVDHSTDLQENITLNVVNTFSGISELCIKYGKFKDRWDIGHFYLHIEGPELIIKSQKTETEFMLGLSRKGVYLKTDLRQTQNLKNMGDVFWKQLFVLSEFPGFEYEEYEFVSTEIQKKYSDLFNGYKCMIFRIFRKYFLGMLEHNEVGSIGEFKIIWTPDTNFVDIVKQCCEAFKIMYKLNYSLWKIEDLKNKKDVK